MACRPSVRGVDSSVIFLVVIGLWAAILVPHWLRRREHLSHSRSVDRFSAAMRVLTRRPAPEELPDRSRTSTYVLTPSREQRALEAAASDDAGDGEIETDTEPAARPAPAAGRRPRRRLARVLGALLLVSLLATPVLGALSVAGLLLPWAAAPAVGTALVLLVALRTSARRRRRLATTVVPVAAVAVVAHPADELADDAAEHEVLVPVAREELFDEAEHAAREETARIRRLAEEALRAADVPYREPEPGEWTPVAVPLPAYLLKPHARPAWQPAQAPPAAPARRHDVDEDDIPLYAPPSRRAAGA